MTTKEKNFFIEKVASSYFNHLRKNRNSFLARIYGVYTVKIQGNTEVHIMLMAHTMQIRKPRLVERIFDLKGSSVDRMTKFTANTSNLKTLKDENFMDLQKKKNSDLVVMFESDRAFILAQM